MDYDGEIHKILSYLDLPTEQVDFKKCLDFIINLRINMIRDYHNLLEDKKQEYEFKLEQVEKLYHNKFEDIISLRIRELTI